MLRRLFSLVSAFAVLFFCSVPAFATGMEIGGAGGAGIPIVGNINLDVVDFFDYVGDVGTFAWNTCRHLVTEEVCPYAPQLEGGHNFVPRRTLKDGQIGKYYVCEYCGKAYGEAMEEAYQQYVDTLPGTRYNSDGAFLWVPDVSYFGNVPAFNFYFWVPSQQSFSVQFRDGWQGVRNTGTGSFVGTLFLSDSFVFSGRNVSSSISLCSVEWPSISSLPWTALYTPVEGCCLSLSPSVFQSGSSISSTNLCASLADEVLTGDFDFHFLWPQFWVILLDISPSGAGSSFSADTRVDGSGNNVTGLYGYMDNGTLVQSAADTIFTESGNVYTNPVTNETKTITTWDYDYTDRSYTLTTNEGDEVTVTYGDTNVTINDGDETYNVYYLVEHDDNVECAHTYSSQVTQSPTCTSGGVRTFTCSTCGNTYTQELPPSGHDYAANVTTAPTCSAPGVRTFTCTVCGDTYTQAIPATGHDYSSSVTQEATCTGTGVRTSVCSVCGDSHTETIPATGHSYSSEITTAPTCTETGVRTFTCSVCGDVRTESVPATGHNYSSEITMQPTCATTGVRTFTCSECGDSYTRSIPATGHRWRILQTVPNQYDTENGGQLVQAGYTVYECDACGEQYRIDAAASGSALPMPSTGGTSTGTELMDGDTGDSVSDVGKGFLLTIANGITEDLPRVLELMSQWFTTVPALFEGYSKFLAASFGWMPPDCVMLLTFGVSMVTLIGILKAIRR